LQISRTPLPSRFNACALPLALLFFRPPPKPPPHWRSFLRNLPASFRFPPSFSNSPVRETELRLAPILLSQKSYCAVTPSLQLTPDAEATLQTYLFLLYLLLLSVPDSLLLRFRFVSRHPTPIFALTFSVHKSYASFCSLSDYNPCLPSSKRGPSSKLSAIPDTAGKCSGVYSA